MYFGEYKDPFPSGKSAIFREMKKRSKEVRRNSNFSPKVREIKHSSKRDWEIPFDKNIKSFQATMKFSAKF